MKSHVNFQKLRTRQLSINQKMYLKAGSSVKEKEDELLRNLYKCWVENRPCRDKQRECIDEYVETLKAVHYIMR